MFTWFQGFVITSELRYYTVPIPDAAQSAKNVFVPRGIVHPLLTLMNFDQFWKHSSVLPGLIGWTGCTFTGVNCQDIRNNAGVNQ